VSVRLQHRFDGPEGAQVLVLLNSLGTNLEMWDDQMPELAQRFRVLRCDARGHGRSPSPAGPYSLGDLGGDVLALLDELELDRVRLAGLSLGGMVAMWVASEAPERVDRLVLACTSAQLGPASVWNERIAEIRGGGMAAVVDGVVERWFTPHAPPEAVAPVRQMLETTPPDGYVASCEAIRDMDLRGRLGDIAAPTLVIAGEEDPVTPPQQAERIAGGVPDARVVVLPGASHLANIEQPEAFTATMLEHLAP
jgi:3-oxoadipate enol-lactonase